VLMTDEGEGKAGVDSHGGILLQLSDCCIAGPENGMLPAT